MSQRGAPAAYRGYRLQALYILDRLLEPGLSEDVVFQPEGREDLDVWDGNGRRCEVVQVKSYASLVLSHLEPAEENSFFKRAETYLQLPEKPTIRLINFGAIGPELQKAWGNDKVFRRSVTAKLAQDGFVNSVINAFFTHIELYALDEQHVRDRVFNYLRALPTGVDPEIAFDALNFWLYRMSEQHTRITRRDILSHITTIGQFLAEQYAHHQEWFTSIVPFDDITLPPDRIPELRNEFYQGVSTRYEHILAGVDFRREQKLQAIAAAFQQARVVLIHGASGQGKTALGLRYVTMAYPIGWRFKIELIRDRQHVLSIARALAGFADAVQIPLCIYIDVSPRDTEWTELVQRLATHPSIHTLVTIREEDLQRAEMTGEAFAYEAIALDFDAAEARELYERAAQDRISHHFLDFDEAWSAFGDRGPLLEFVYLLTQTTTLRERLQGQLTRIRNEVQRIERPVEDVHLLRLVAFASVYEVRIHIPSLIGNLNLSDAAFTLQRFEREYLIRISPDGLFVEGLHPIRSGIILELLLDPIITPWRDVASQVISLLNEDDLESFLLHAFVKQPQERVYLRDVVSSQQLASWNGVVGVLRAFLWDDVYTYVKQNAQIVQDAYAEFKQAWWLILDFNVMNIDGNSTPELLAPFDAMMSDERRQRMEALRARQTPHNTIWQRTRDWFNTRNPVAQIPMTTSDWASVAEVWFWLARFDVGNRESYRLSDEVLVQAVLSLDVSTLADVSLALSVFDPPQHARWLAQHTLPLQNRLAHEYQVVALEAQEHLLKLHFLVADSNVERFPEQTALPQPLAVTSFHGQTAGRSLHGQTIERISLVRRLFPTYQLYGSQGYGHLLRSVLPVPVDDTYKSGISVSALHPTWLLRPNMIAHGLGRLLLRPHTWTDYVNSIVQMRHRSVVLLAQFVNALTRYHQQGNKGGQTTIFTTYIDPRLWMECFEAMSNPPPLPQLAVDPWGFANEIQASERVRHIQNTAFVPHALVNDKYRAYTQSETYLTSLSNFLQQASDVVTTNRLTAHYPDNSPHREKILTALQARGVRTDWTHIATYNLWDAKQHVEQYQTEFRKLFGHIYVSEVDVVALEAHEREVLSKLWPLWFFFAWEPSQRWTSPRNQTIAQFRSTEQRLRQQFKQAGAQVSRPGVRVNLLDGGRWENNSAYWLQLDLDRPEELYQQFEALVSALRTTIGAISYQTPMFYVLQEQCTYTVIVPTIRGRAFRPFAWHLATQTTILTEVPNDNQQHQWKYIQKEIPGEVWKKWNLSIVDTPQLAPANQFSTGVAEILLRVGILAEFAAIPTLTDEGEKVVQDFLNDQAGAIGRCIEVVSDAVSALAKQFCDLSEGDQQQRFYLREAAANLQEAFELTKPPVRLPNREFAFRIADMTLYAQNLQRALQLAEAIRLLWIADMLAQKEGILNGTS